MGRVWVYIPGVSARNSNITYARYSTAREPMNSDGTPGKPIESKRQGFIRAFPMKSHAGSDRLRESPNQSDGRNPQLGESNAYGDFQQGRNGDMVAVCFMGGDPSKCYIMGHVPKTGETDMVPGLKQNTTDASGSGVATNVGPSYETGSDNKTTKPLTTFFHNLTDSGLIQDPLRGCGSTSSTRESPSRVRGMKTPGDPDTNMTGHQIVMDDLPDSQLMRLRTSKGMQILLCDTGDFLYMSTATGKTWIEIDDTGNCMIFAHSSVSIHSEQDFNMTCDRDFNLHVGGNYNSIVNGDTRMRMNKGGNITVGEGGGDLDITTIHSLHVKTQEEIRMGAKTGFTMKSADFMAQQSAKKMSMKSAKEWEVSADDLGSMKIKKAMTIQTSDDAFNVKSGKAINMKASGGDYNMDTSANMNATKSSLSVDDAKTVDDAHDPNQADIPLQHSVAKPPQTSGPPTASTGLMKTATAVVPQHEPWMGHRSQPPGHDAAMNPSSIPKL